MGWFNYHFWDRKTIRKINQLRAFFTHSKGGVGKSTLAFSLHDRLPNSIIVDRDPQGTALTLAEVSEKELTISSEEPASGYDYCIIDTPPYLTANSKNEFEGVDLILIPCKVKLPDAFAIKDTVRKIEKYGLEDKAVIILNEVRKPHNKTYHEVKKIIEDLYPHMNIAPTELSLLVGFERVFVDPLEGTALEQIDQLIKDVNLHTN